MEDTRRRRIPEGGGYQKVEETRRWEYQKVEVTRRWRIS